MRKQKVVSRVILVVIAVLSVIGFVGLGVHAINGLYEYDPQIPKTVMAGEEVTFVIPERPSSTKYRVTVNIGQIAGSPETEVIVDSTSSAKKKPDGAGGNIVGNDIFTADNEGVLRFTYQAIGVSARQTANVHVVQEGGGFDQTYPVQITSEQAKLDAFHSVTSIALVKNERLGYAQEGGAPPIMTPEQRLLEFEFRDAPGKAVTLEGCSLWCEIMNPGRNSATIVGSISNLRQESDQPIDESPISVFLENLPEDLRTNPVELRVELRGEDGTISISRTITIEPVAPAGR